MLLIAAPLAVFFLAMLASPSRAAPPDALAENWRTRAEQTDFRETARYEETMAYCQRLAAARPDAVRIETLGQSPEGRAIIALVVSLDGAFTPEAARATGKEIVYINACIHPGECEGKDAGLALLRDLLVLDQGKTNGLLDHTILLFVPIHGVDGHERFGPWNRINQKGPAEMGWRTTAQNYNLNRDWLKADAPEMHAVLDLFRRWLPDLLIDTHTTDGADYRYDLTYSFIAFTTLARPLTVEVETSIFDKVEWQPKPFENHHQLKDFQTHTVRRKMTFPAGSAFVDVHQRTAKVIAHLLEPAAPDSLLCWGYLDAIFEQKEYADDTSWNASRVR